MLTTSMEMQLFYVPTVRDGKVVAQICLQNLASLSWILEI